jgi:tetratricopeptide (TPR) repeat protein
MDPNYSEYHNERGNIFLKVGRLEEARANYLRAIDPSPPYFEVFTNLGQCYRRMGRLNEAIEWYSRALDLEPDQPLAIEGRARPTKSWATTRPRLTTTAPRWLATRRPGKRSPVAARCTTKPAIPRPL